MAVKLTEDEMKDSEFVKSVDGFDKFQLNVLYLNQYNFQLGIKEANDVLAKIKSWFSNEDDETAYQACLKIKPEELLENGLDTWRDEKGTKFTVRLKNYFFKEKKIKLPSALLENIGNALGYKVIVGDQTYFKFVDKFDWKAGDFGDSGSCFWGGRDYSKQAILDNGGRAVLFYDVEGKGMARAWLVETENGIPCFFNAYGVNLEAVMKFLSSISGDKIAKVSFPNTSDVAVNNSEMYGLTKKGASFEWSFGWNSFAECPTCGKVTERGKGKLSPSLDTSALTKSRRIEKRCPTCKRLHYNCMWCHENHKEEALIKFNPKGNNFDTVYWVCPNCFEIIYITCCVCGEKMTKNEFVAEGRILRHKEKCQKP